MSGAVVEWLKPIKLEPERIDYRIRTYESGAPVAAARLAKMLFFRFASQWKRQSLLMSSEKEMVELPSYQKNIRLGSAVVSLIFAEMQKEPDFWFHALEQILQTDPVPENFKGSNHERVEIWLQWAKQNNL